MRTLAAIKATLAIVVIVAACLSFLFSGETPLSVHAFEQHACAPTTPPPVPGPLSAPATTPGTLFINETLFNPSAQSQWNCDTTEFNQWLELFNPQDQAFDLYGAHTTIDSGPNTNSYYLPFGAAIAPHGFLTLFPEINPLFSKAEISTLRLLISGVVIDTIAFPTLDPDTSYARVPDGSANWQPAANPTINASNLPIQSTPTPSPASNTPTPESSATMPLAPGSTATTTPISSSPTPHSKRNSGSHSTGTTSSTLPSSSSQQPFTNGTPPTWEQIHRRAFTPSPTTISTPTLSTAPVPSTPEPQDNLLLRKMLMTALATALASILLWCWKLFRSS